MPHGRKTPLPEERFPAGRFYPSPAVYKQQSGVRESDISPRERGRGLKRYAESQRHQHGEHGGTEGHGAPKSVSGGGGAADGVSGAGGRRGPAAGEAGPGAG